MSPIKSFTTVKEVKTELKNNCFAVYVSISESKLKVLDIKTTKQQVKVKGCAKGWYSTNPVYSWVNCTLTQLEQQ